MLLKPTSSPHHPPPAGGTNLNSGPTVSTDEMSLLALVNLRGPGELLVTDLNIILLKVGGERRFNLLPGTPTSCP